MSFNTAFKAEILGLWHSMSWNSHVPLLSANALNCATIVFLGWKCLPFVCMEGTLFTKWLNVMRVFFFSALLGGCSSAWPSVLNLSPNLLSAVSLSAGSHIVLCVSSLLPFYTYNRWMRVTEPRQTTNHRNRKVLESVECLVVCTYVLYNKLLFINFYFLPSLH